MERTLRRYSGVADGVSVELANLRIAALASRIAFLAALTTFGLAAFRLAAEGTHSRAGWVLFASGFGFGVVRVLLSASPTQVNLRHAIPGVGLAGTTLMALLAGGLHSESLFWVPFVPVVAGFMCGRSATVPFALASAGAVVVVGVLHVAGHIGAPTAAWGLMLRFAAVLSATIFGGVLAVSYESHRREAEQRLWRAATHDSLTQLPSRSLLFSHLEQALRQGAQSDAGVGVVFIDVDLFKQINDRHGHDVGDQVLQAVGARLDGATRRSELACRLGGDEFVVVLEDANQAALRCICDRLGEALSRPVRVRGKSIDVTVSLGGVVAQPSDSPRSVLQRADASMYRAKRKQREQQQPRSGVRSFISVAG